jgi:hypothetical protein
VSSAAPLRCTLHGARGARGARCAEFLGAPDETTDHPVLVSQALRPLSFEERAHEA